MSGKVKRKSRVMVTKDSVLHLPSQPGIYIFYDGKVPIYIGKSVNLKARVLSHIASATLSRKEAAIITDADRVETTNTLSDLDAIILEAKLIRAHKPRYNVIWKDDKKFLYIKITTKETYPKLMLCRAEQDGRSLYFGPFQSHRVAESLLRQIRRIIPFCMQKKISTASCFYARIGLCNPCPSFIEKQEGSVKVGLKREYRLHIRQIIAILSGKSQKLMYQYQKDLKVLSKVQNYEEALLVRNKLDLLNNLLNRSQFENPMHINLEPDKDLDSELGAFLDICFRYDLGHDTYRVECFDISNLFGTHPTGSMVVFGDGAYTKSQYRRFKIKTVKKISDFDMLKEMLERRLKRKDWPKPDLIIIDGGRPQVRIASRVLEELEQKIPLIGLAKKPDRIVFPDSVFVHKPPARTSSLFKMFQGLRDESHRFAKKYHVLLRDKSTMPS
ncbi:MAG: GIY-YIG nuclease family protein [Candidatus Roizmanbacteria bacterium]